MRYFIGREIPSGLTNEMVSDDIIEANGYAQRLSRIYPESIIYQDEYNGRGVKTIIRQNGRIVSRYERDYE